MGKIKDFWGKYGTSIKFLVSCFGLGYCYSKTLDGVFDIAYDAGLKDGKDERDMLDAFEDD